MLEDDCEVSRFFFRYLLLVLEKFDIPNKLTANPADFFTSDLENLVGISLYAPILNELVSPTRNWSSASIFNSSYGSPSSSAEFSSTFGLRVRSASSCLNTLLPCPALYRFQLPCSWGALYFPWWWIRLQRYYRYRTSKANMHLDVSYLVPNSYSNFWSKSWKKWA
ncbi:putative mitochondrial carrier C8C9 [Mitosporidium daphniae]|uniref:Putative mitochondrial carrier C8C9 n=1 Tax=Mitosporidium daphniae TaxID=1485682 RepID=A0A098VSE0_9MICR|nr:putative mitochondrial carrier C8C9 [Mitosporidium daphniae]KGG50666.1 putative mitochondrial carrier C8C9 [Mitosporidium daphniae]|eukprot:XP_013237093.1 putative mitochondrial carrier C8C9 [Mitosporidium daphniae]